MHAIKHANVYVCADVIKSMIITCSLVLNMTYVSIEERDIGPRSIALAHVIGGHN